MKKLFLSLSIIISSTGYADTSVSHTVVSNVAMTSSKKLHTLAHVRSQRSGIVKAETLAETSKKLHTLDYARLQKNRIVKATETKKVEAHKETLAEASKKLHTLDYARLQKNRIVKVTETKKVEAHKETLAEASKKLHTLDYARLQKTRIVKVAEAKQTLSKTSNKLHTLVRVATTKIVKVKNNSKVNTTKLVALSKPKKIQKIAKQKLHTIKHKVKKPVKLAKALNGYIRKPETSKTIAKNKVTLSDIFFKSSRSRTLSNNIENGKAANIINIAKTKLGKKYVWGAVGKRGTFDCSGFTSYVYKKNGIHIPRTSRNQAKYGKYVARNNLKKGDLIFFDTSRRRKGYVNHVGIYLGNGKFIHASSAQKRVVVSSLSKFYAKRYVGARRPS